MSFLIRDDKLLKKYNEIWEIVRNSIKIKEFDSKLVYEEKYLKTKITKISKNYYLQAFLEEYEYVLNEKRCLSILLTT